MITFHSAPIDVLLMVRTLDQGGIERDVAKIATHLDRSRFTPHVCTSYEGGMRYDELRDAGIPILHLPVESVVSLGALRASVQLFRYLKRHSIQVVHAFDVSGVVGAVTARIAGVPAVLTAQLGHRFLLDRGTRAMLRLSDRFAHAIVVNSEAMRRDMIETERIAADRIELCYNGVDTTEFYPVAPPAPRPEALAGNSPVIGTVCVLRPEKALPVLQEAFASIRSRVPGVKLAIAGSGGELAALEANAARLGIAADSVFIPATRRPAAWMRAMDVFVLPSYSESFSNSLLEAMACGCCVVGSRVGGTPELIGENERGRLFASGDAAGLAAQLLLLLENEPLRRDLGQRAARFARERLSVEVAAARTAAIYEKWLRKGGVAVDGVAR